MRKISLFALMISMIAIIGINANAQTDEVMKKGYLDYIDYLKANKDVLNYNTYGLIEGLEEIVLKIYCHKDVMDQLVSSLKDFTYNRYEVKVFEEDQIVISIYFPIPRESEPEAIPEPVTKVEEKPEIREAQPIIQPQPVMEKRIAREG